MVENREISKIDFFKLKMFFYKVFLEILLRNKLKIFYCREKVFIDYIIYEIRNVYREYIKKFINLIIENINNLIKNV